MQRQILTFHQAFLLGLIELLCVLAECVGIFQHDPQRVVSAIYLCNFLLVK